MEKNIKVYWVFIGSLITIVIIMATAKFGESQEFINQITFAATISSILLALVTINFAISQIHKSHEQERIITNSLNKINAKIDELNKINDKFLMLKNATESGYDELKKAISKLGNAQIDYVNNEEDMLKFVNNLYRMNNLSGDGQTE